MNFFDFGTFFFFVAAVVIFLQLRNVLGRRTGNERPPSDPYTSARKSDQSVASKADVKDNVVALPRRQNVEPVEKDFTSIDAIAPVDTPLNTALRSIRSADENFEPKSFISGVKMAYEMIVQAFADGDRKALKNLLSKDVYEGFEAALNEREAKGEKVNSTFIGISQANIIAADMKDRNAQVTLRIVSEMISATLDSQGVIIDGDLENIIEVKDIWTFARDTQSRNPNWKLIATEAEV